jgi:hypothetical protein
MLLGHAKLSNMHPQTSINVHSCHRSRRNASLRSIYASRPKSFVLNRNLDRSSCSICHPSTYATVNNTSTISSRTSRKAISSHSPPQPPRQRLPSNGPLGIFVRGSPDRVLSFMSTNPVATGLRWETSLDECLALSSPTETQLLVSPDIRSHSRKMPSTH